MPDFESRDLLRKNLAYLDCDTVRCVPIFILTKSFFSLE